MIRSILQVLREFQWLCQHLRFYCFLRFLKLDYIFLVSFWSLRPQSPSVQGHFAWHLNFQILSSVLPSLFCFLLSFPALYFVRALFSPAGFFALVLTQYKPNCLLQAHMKDHIFHPYRGNIPEFFQHSLFLPDLSFSGSSEFRSQNEG